MLSHGRGVLAKFRDSWSIADCIEYVLDHPEEKKEMERKTLEIGKTMMWDRVAEQYKDLFISVLKQYENTHLDDTNITISTPVHPAILVTHTGSPTSSSSTTR
jgi:hypothetical protein